MEQTISIEKILKELYHISGFRISVYDTYFQEIAAFPKELGCLCSLIQENPCLKNQNSISCFTPPCHITPYRNKFSCQNFR